MDNVATEETLAQTAMDRLEADIRSGELRPGAKLRIDELRSHYGISSSPLREALTRLTGLGFVTNASRRGWRVADTSHADLADITRVRQMVEGQMLRESISATSNVEWEVGIVGAYTRLSRLIGYGGDDAAAQIDAAHQQFHFALLAGCQSPRLIQLQKQLYDQAVRYRKLMLQEINDPEDFLRRHKDLMETILSRDFVAANDALCAHLQLTLAKVYKEPATKDF